MKLVESKALLFSFQVRVLSMGPRPGPKLVLKSSQRARSTGAKANHKECAASYQHTCTSDI